MLQGSIEGEWAPRGSQPETSDFGLCSLSHGFEAGQIDDHARLFSPDGCERAGTASCLPVSRVSFPVSSSVAILVKGVLIPSPENVARPSEAC